MEQCKLKKVMELTQRWIQDNNYTNHAKTMKHYEWHEMVKHKWNPDMLWTFEDKNHMIIDNGRLTDRGRSIRPMDAYDRCQTTYMFTYSDSCSTKSEINLADYGK